jgi:hypothetical protein
MVEIKMNLTEGEIEHDVEYIMFDKKKYIKSDSFAFPVPDLDTDYYEKLNTVQLMGNFLSNPIT